MHAGPDSNNIDFGDQNFAPHAVAPLTFQYSHTQKFFNATQEHTLQSYFDDQILANFQAFINTAPDALKALRQLIVAYAPHMPCDSFQLFIKQFYLEVEPTNITFKQNVFFRGLLISFNQLCNKQVDVDHPLYQTVFDPKISPTKSSSPTKQNLVASFFIKKIADHFAFPGNDPFVTRALDWIKVNTPRFIHPVAAAGESTARRQLNFNC